MAARLAEDQEHFSSHPASASISSAGSRTHWASYWHSTSHLDQTLLIIEVKRVAVLTQPCLAAGGAAATGRDPAAGLAGLALATTDGDPALDGEDPAGLVVEGDPDGAARANGTV